MRRFSTAAIAVSIAVVLAGCSASTPDASPTAKAAATTSSTPTPTASQAAVDLLPLMDGTAAGLPEGWTSDECAGLSFAVPPGWSVLAEGTGRFTYGDQISYAVPASPTTNGVYQTFTVECTGEATDWNGDWEVQDGDESHRVDAPGSKYAAMYLRVSSPVDLQAAGHILPSDQILGGQFQFTTQDDIYYSMEFTLPPNEAGNEIVRVLAGNFAFN